MGPFTAIAGGLSPVLLLSEGRTRSSFVRLARTFALALASPTAESGRERTLDGRGGCRGGDGGPRVSLAVAAAASSFSLFRDHPHLRFTLGINMSRALRRDAGRASALPQTARSAPDALPLRSVVATRSRRAGRRAVSVGGRRSQPCRLVRGASGSPSAGPATVLPSSAGDGGTVTRSVHTWRSGLPRDHSGAGSACRPYTAPPSRAGARACG